MLSVLFAGVGACVLAAAMVGILPPVSPESAPVEALRIVVDGVAVEIGGASARVLVDVVSVEEETDVNDVGAATRQTVSE